MTRPGGGAALPAGRGLARGLGTWAGGGLLGAAEPEKQVGAGGVASVHPPPPALGRGGGQTWREPLPGPSAVHEGRAWGARPGRVRPGRERTETPGDACPAGGVGAGPGGSSGPFRPGAASAVGACLFPVRGRLREHVGAGEEGGVRKGRWPASGGARGAPARGNSKARKGRRGRAWWGGGLQVGSWPLAALEWSLCALASRGLRCPRGLGLLPQ